MIKNIIQAIAKWIKFWLWEKPISKPEPDIQYKLKATDVAKEYVVVVYDGQRISLHRNELAMWHDKRIMTRKEKRAMKAKYERLEKSGQIRFETIEGREVCIRNKDYQAKADQIKQNHGT
jgi:hypothetical protein